MGGHIQPFADFREREVGVQQRQQPQLGGGQRSDPTVPRPVSILERSCTCERRVATSARNRCSSARSSSVRAGFSGIGGTVLSLLLTVLRARAEAEHWIIASLSDRQVLVITCGG
jgi:hypothetical protein